jgi:hypothetical protein
MDMLFDGSWSSRSAPYFEDEPSPRRCAKVHAIFNQVCGRWPLSPSRKSASGAREGGLRPERVATRPDSAQQSDGTTY